MADTFHEDDDGIVQGLRSEKHRLRRVMRTHIERLAEDAELAQAHMRTEELIAAAIVDALSEGGADAFDKLANKLARAVDDDVLVAMAYAFLSAIPATRAIWLVRDLFQMQPWPFSTADETHRQVMSEARQWAKDSNPVQLKAYAAEIIKAMPQTDRRNLLKWLEARA